MRAIKRFGAACALAATALAAACGGGSSDTGADGRMRTSGAQAAATQPLQLFAPDLETAALTTFTAYAPGAGETLEPRTLALLPGAGDNVQLDRVRGELYAIAGRQVVVYAGASALGTGALPARRFPLPPVLRKPRALYLDRANDVLYVGGEAAVGGVIVAYPAAHAARGITAQPARTLHLEGGVVSFTIDPLRRRLYVADTAGAVRAYAGVDTARGLLAAVNTYPVLGSGLAIDSAHDRLYVADLFAGLILVDRASAPAAAVSATLSIADARHVAFDALHDRAIVSAQRELYVFEHASALGAASPVPLPATLPSAGAALGAVDWL
jgi:hypothetical protein